MFRDRVVALLIFVAFASSSCGSSEGEDLHFTPGRQRGVADPLSADATHAYAGHVPVGALPTVASEVEDLRVWKEGDFLLANDKIAVVIEGEGPSDHFDPWGGKIVGLARVQDGAMIEPAQINEVGITVARYTIQTRDVGIVNDGRDGNAAVVRVIGPLAPIPFIDDTIRPIISTDYDGFWAAADYVLEPGAEHYDVRYAFYHPEQTEILPDPLFVFALQAYTMQTFGEDQGFRTPISSGLWEGFVTQGGTSYAFEMLTANTPMERIVTPGLGLAGANLYFAPMNVVMPADAETFTPLARFHVGGPDADGLFRVMMRATSVAERAITGSVFESDGTTPVVGAEVHARVDATHYLTRAISDASGHYVLHVPAAADVELFAWRRGNVLAGPFTVPAAQTTRDLQMEPTGRLHLTIQDADTNAAIPAKVQIRPAAGEPLPPPAFGVEPNGAGRVFQLWPTGGDLTVPLSVGTHHVTVSRGPEYDVLSTDVTITSATTLELTAALSRDVDTSGVLCGDFHVHTNRSPDASDSVQRKLGSAVGEGLELPVRSDHEWTNDFEPAIARLGLESYVYGLSSLELTTYWWGHFGIFPLAEQPDAPNMGSIPWYDAYSGEGYRHRTPIEVFDEALVRDHPTWGRPTIIINHPRSTDTPIVGKAFAYFAAMGYDPVTGAWQEPTHDERFNLIEAFNDSDFDANYTTDPLSATSSRAVNDWFSFLDRGLSTFVVGSSDSHGVTDSPVGYPRTCIQLGTDDPDAIRGMPDGPARIRDQLLAGHVTISGGIYVDAWARYAGGTGQGPGSTVGGASATEMVRVRVQAAEWVDADRLRVFVNGELAQTIPLDGSSPGAAAPALRYDASIAIPVTASGRSYVIFVADGTDTMDEVYPRGASGRRPFGVTNPIFFTR